MAIKFDVAPLQISSPIVGANRTPTIKFQRDINDLIAATRSGFGQVQQILETQAEQQTQLEAQQAQLADVVSDLSSAVDDIADVVAKILGMLAGTEVFTGLNVDGKRVDNFVGGLDAAGQRIVNASVTPLNYPSGSARSYDDYPLTSTDSAISIGGVGYDEPGAAGSLTSGSVSGLSADTTYRVFYNPAGNFYTAQPPPAGVYFSSPDGWQFIGDIKTSVGGVYTPPPAPPSGYDPGYYSGGMNLFY